MSTSDEPRCVCGAYAGEEHTRVCAHWKQEKFTVASDEPRERVAASRWNGHSVVNFMRDVTEAEILVLDAVLAEVAKGRTEGVVWSKMVSREALVAHAAHAIIELLEMAKT